MGGEDMAKDTLLVTGIHRDELGFGDRVAALIDPGSVDLLRIPEGIPQPKRSPSNRFISRTQHHELYLQLYQQVKGRTGLLIDLHQGLDEAGRSAEIYCHDPAFLQAFEARQAGGNGPGAARLIQITAPGSGAAAGEAEAHTWIPPKVWALAQPLYIGLEIYLPNPGEGRAEDWDFALMMIAEIRACAGA